MHFGSYNESDKKHSLRSYLMAGIADVELMVIERYAPLSLDRPHLTLSEALPSDFKIPNSLPRRQVVALSIAERHRILAGCLPGIVADFENHPELREFSMLDGLDWEPEDD
jgi:hypothetical protein